MIVAGVGRRDKSVTTDGLVGAFGFAAVGGWNLWTAWAYGPVFSGSDFSRRDSPLMFWSGVVVYGGFVVVGTGFLVVGLFERFAT